MATHSSVLAWRIPGMGEPGGQPSMGSHRVGHDWSDLAAAAAAAVTDFIFLDSKNTVDGLNSCHKKCHGWFVPQVCQFWDNEFCTCVSDSPGAWNALPTVMTFWLIYSLLSVFPDSLSHFPISVFCTSPSKLLAFKILAKGLLLGEPKLRLRVCMCVYACVFVCFCEICVLYSWICIIGPFYNVGTVWGFYPLFL